jgi:hypothetical protein
MPSRPYHTTRGIDFDNRNEKHRESATGIPFVKSLRHWLGGLSAYSMSLICLLMLGWALAPSNATAQAVYGNIGGTVVDASGGGVGAAKVTITDLDRNIVHTPRRMETAPQPAHLIIGNTVCRPKCRFKTSIAEVNVQVDTTQTVDLRCNLAT